MLVTLRLLEIASTFSARAHHGLSRTSICPSASCFTSSLACRRVSIPQPTNVEPYGTLSPSAQPDVGKSADSCCNPLQHAFVSPLPPFSLPRAFESCYRPASHLPASQSKYLSTHTGLRVLLARREGALEGGGARSPLFSVLFFPPPLTLSAHVPTATRPYQRFFSDMPASSWRCSTSLLLEMPRPSVTPFIPLARRARPKFDIPSFGRCEIARRRI